MQFGEIKSYIVIFLIASFSLAGCSKEMTPEEKRQAAANAVGIDASMTAMFFVSAVRACQVVRVEDVKQCARLSGSLLDEQIARQQAELSLTHVDRYRKACQANFTPQYCDELLFRAVDIDERKPRK